VKSLFVYVEGTTEEIFVERLLRHHLAAYGVKVERPLLAKKDFDPDGPRGGFTNWPAMEADLRDWFAEFPDPQARFTTLLDLYAMPAEVPGYPGRGAATTANDVAAVETAINTQMREPRFSAYLQRHEFEALLLTHPPAFARIFPGSAEAIGTLEQEITCFLSPEDINHGRQTHPAARIKNAIPDYYDLKASHAYWVAAEIPLEMIRARCPRFNAWLEKWESWGMA
jgi:hypothetical protein